MATNSIIAPTFSDNNRLTVVNMYGGAGCGKSVTAAQLFSMMKCANMKAELVYEIAKECVWDRRSQMFTEQDWMFANQHHLVRRLVGHDIDYAVLDSPILLALFYLLDDYPPSFTTFVMDVFNSYNNVNILIKRNPAFEYIQAGRNQDLAGASEIDLKIFEFFKQHDIPFIEVMAGPDAAAQCLEIVKNHKRSTDVCPKCGHDWLDHEFAVPAPYCP